MIKFERYLCIESNVFVDSTNIGTFLIPGFSFERNIINNKPTLTFGLHLLDIHWYTNICIKSYNDES